MSSPDCVGVQDILSDLFDGRFAVGDPARLRAERHLEACADCRLVLEDFARLREALRPVPAAVADPEAFAGRLEARLEAESRRQRLLRVRFVAAAAALVLTAGVGVVIFRAPIDPAPAATPAPEPATPIQVAESVPPSWKPLGDATPATLAELAEQQALDSLVDDLRLLRGGRGDRDAIYREVASVRDLSRRPHLLREATYAP